MKVCPDCHAGCQTQEYWAYIDTFWRSSLPDGLYEVFGGTSSNEITSPFNSFLKLILIDEDCNCRNILGQMLISQFHVYQWMKGKYLYAKSVRFGFIFSQLRHITLFARGKKLLLTIIFIFLYIVGVDHWSLSSSRASDYELVKIDRNGRITQFAEKPKGSDLKAMVYISSTWKLSNISHPFYVPQRIWIVA